MAQPYRAIISDLDGTLLNGEHQLASFTIETLEKLAAKGVDIFFATGRSEPDVKRIIRSVNIDKATLVTANGARATNLGGELLVSHYLPEDIVLDIFHHIPFDPFTVCLNSYQGDEWFINVDVEELKKFHQASGFMYQVTDFHQQHAKQTEKIFYIGRTPENLAPIEASIRERFGDQVQVTYSTPQCLEIMAKGVCKAATLAELAAKRGYSLTDCIAFGDGMNDVEMLAQVGKGCIMGNADPRLKQALPNNEVIGRNTDHAVANKLREIFDID
ncbi:MAG: Cof-type HAD-IIB family hydrolase [Pasteurella oralis]|uniref:Cof-type HAD-IIB family hydrolase n=1 Tax=Pasteurella oralis TaxID=1071947 RepID=UPI0027037387|nr:Cof-type HAD-IIB family hydrolase [Pasteurella oralis]